MIAEPKTPGEMTRMIYRSLYGDGNGNPGLIADMREVKETLSERKPKMIAAWAPYFGAFVSLAIAIIALLK